MKRLIALFSITGALLLIASPPVTAQSLFSWEIRGGADYATQGVGNADLNTGFGADAIISYWFMPFTSVYGGWGWHRFTSDGTFAGSNMDFKESGYTFGLEFTYPIARSEHGFYIRGGGIYDQITAESSNGDITADSGYDLGWQAEAGLAFHLGSQWVVKPGVRYRSLSQDIEINGAATGIDLTYFNFSIGVSRPFNAN